MKLDKVILASDSNPQFLNFWPIAAKSWNKIFGLVPTLALISTKLIDERTLEKLRTHGQVHFEISSSRAPIANQAKMFRWYLASKFENQVATIEDIDTIYLKPEYLKERLSHYIPGQLLGIGDDVSQDDPFYKGKFPASNLTGSGFEFQKFFNSSQKETFEEFLLRFKGLQIFDLREDPFNKPNNFSDESLIRALRAMHSEVEIKTISRGVDIHSSWMDRSWWPQNGVIPNTAILANMPRPLFNNQIICQELIAEHFPNGYPWIYPRKSRFWENPDSKFQTRVRLINYYLRNFREISRKWYRKVNENV